MKGIFREQQVHLVIENPAFTTDGMKNILANINTDSLPGSPASMKSSFESPERETPLKQILLSLRENYNGHPITQSATGNISPSKTRRGTAFLRDFPIGKTVNKMLESSNQVDEAKTMEESALHTPLSKKQEKEIKDRINLLVEESNRKKTPKKSKSNTITMDKYRSELSKTLELTGEERKSQLELVKLLKDQLIIEGNFSSPSRSTDEDKRSDTGEKHPDYKGFELRTSLNRKALELLNKHVHVNIISSIKGKYNTDDPSIIWKALVKRYRRNELTVEQNMIDKLPSFTPYKNQSLEDFMDVIDQIYHIIRNIRGIEVSDEKKKDNLRIILHRHKADNTVFQALRANAFLNSNVSYENIVQTMIDIDNIDKDLRVENYMDKFTKASDKNNKESSSKPVKENYKHINYIDQSNNPNNNEKRTSYNHDTQKSDGHTSFKQGKYRNNKKRFRRYKGQNPSSHDQPNTQSDHRATPPPKQQDSRTNNYQQNKKVEFKQETMNTNCYFEVLDGPDDDDGDINDIHMSEKVEYKKEIDHDEDTREPDEIDSESGDDVPIPLYRPKSLQQLMENVIEEVYDELCIPVPYDSNYRIMIENILRGFKKNDIRIENIMEYYHTLDVDDYIMTFKEDTTSPYELALAIIAHPYIRKALYENYLPHEVRIRAELYCKNLMKLAARELRRRLTYSEKYWMSKNRVNKMTCNELLNTARNRLDHQMDLVTESAKELEYDSGISMNLIKMEDYSEVLKENINQLIDFVNSYALFLSQDDYVLQDTGIPLQLSIIDRHRMKYDPRIGQRRSSSDQTREKIVRVDPEKYAILSPEEINTYKENKSKAVRQAMFGNNTRGYIPIQRSMAKIANKKSSMKANTAKSHTYDSQDDSESDNEDINLRRSERVRAKKQVEDRTNSDKDNINMAVNCKDDENTVLYTQDTYNDTDIIIDSGASVHMFHNPSLLFNIRNKKTTIRFGNGKCESYDMIGDAGLLRDVVLTTTASKNIMSIGKITDIGYSVTIKGNEAYISDQNNNIVSTASKRKDGLLYLNDMNIVTPLAEECHLRLSDESKGGAPNRLAKFHAGINPLNVLHNRLGHISEGSIKAMVSSGNVIGVEYTYDTIKNLHLDPCDACMRGKMTKLPAYSTTQPTDYKPFEKLGSDIAGAMNVVSLQGNKYLILYIDYKTNFIAPYFVERKSQLLDTFKELYKEVKEKGHRIMILQSDSESVFKDEKVGEWCNEHAIQSQFSPAYFHEGNGKVERAIRTVVTTARTMMLANNAPANLWQYAIIYAAKIHNRIPRKSLGMKSPYEIIFSQKPDVSPFVPFYAKGWMLKYKDERKRKGKFDSVSEPCHFLGLAPHSKHAFIVRLKDGRILERRDCQFTEHLEPVGTGDRAIDAFVTQTDVNSAAPPSEGVQDDKGIEDNDQNTQNSNIRTQRHQQSLRNARTKQAELSTRRSERNKLIPKYLQQYVYANEITIDIPTPKSVKEALAPNNKYRDEWLKAIDKEMTEMWSRGSLVKVDIEEVKNNNRKPFKSKFVFKVKHEPDGSIRFKARLVGCGYSQIKGIDYTHTYAPTPGFHLVIIILHISVVNSWNIIANDIGNAYLEAQADTLLYMNLPKDYTNGIQQVVRLDGNINGTKQGALLWANVIGDVLLKFGCIRSKIEPCLYIYKKNTDIIYTIVYVDDILMTGNNNRLLDKLQQHLSKSFKKVTNQGEVRKFLGVQIKRETINDSNYFILHHHDYIIEKTKDVCAVRNKNTPLPINLKQLKDDDEPKVEPIHDLVGQIRFLADRCRPDVAFAASFLARFSINATQHQINACNRVLQYLNITKDEGIKVGSKSKEITLTAFADASFATEDDSKSQLCYALYLAEDSGTCLFKSWKDKAVSTSSTHAEIHALFDTIKTIIWYRELLRELQYPQVEPTIIYQDNMNVINLSDYSARDNMTKFLINKINFIREAITDKIIVLKYIKTEEMIADIGTKSLDYSTHRRLKESLFNGFNSVKDINNND